MKTLLIVPLLVMLLGGLQYLRVAACPHSQAVHPDERANAQRPIDARPIVVYLDGKRIPTRSELLVSPSGGHTLLTPVLVNGHLMVPVRFVRERLKSTVWIDWRWGIIQLDVGLTLKIGKKEAHAKPLDYGIDGTAVEVIPLSVAPSAIAGRLFMPVEPKLFERMGYIVEWDRERRVLSFHTRGS